MTVTLPQTYSACGGTLQFEIKRAPRRCLTKPAEPAEAEGIDNAEGDLIVFVGDILGDVDPHKCVAS